ncbi:hypothetical protein JD844_019382 [Phrynosoma platyrhinos]|uniref:CDK5 regulatory subunit associated protein 1 n=1 Tax=Phrynosoma platyrhinos TaxID=52577 RepID=A0ABQ7SPW1_PHRPL|nr:hypothetical protein JD844_019382 [Phrynosoma platyrhinos]
MLPSMRGILGSTSFLCQRPLRWTSQKVFLAWLSTCGLDSRTCAEESVKGKGSLENFHAKLAAGPSLQHFLQGASHHVQETQPLPAEEEETSAPYLGPSILAGPPKKVYLETYGCQMNVSDTEIAWSVLQRSGYLRTTRLEEADVILLVTCSIREKAEQTIWNRLNHLKSVKLKRPVSQGALRIGILGCMAERLKEKILDQERMVDVVAGPDAYRDLPRLLAVAESGQQAANVLLSLEETYADILPVQTSPSATSAFVGNLVKMEPFKQLGVKEVTLLGQNVNSYRDTSEVQFLSAAPSRLSRGFSTVYKPKQGGLRFAELLDCVSAIDPEMRIRFTSPHPKDFPDEHVTYTREAYLELVHHVRESLPGVTLSSDIIAGFCGETEADHQQTVSLVREVRYNTAFIFAYSERQKTRAFHRLKDDVPPDVKRHRVKELTDVFREGASQANVAAVGQTQVVLVEGPSKRSALELYGRNDGNIKVIFPDVAMDDGKGSGSAVRARPGDYVLVKVICGSFTFSPETSKDDAGKEEERFLEKFQMSADQLPMQGQNSMCFFWLFSSPV